ncbi:peptidase M48, Ste24p [Alicycliphilus sp. B1]|nr:peptidase M48, Ste24p [Alicycliphilus sp. B1]
MVAAFLLAFCFSKGNFAGAAERIQWNIKSIPEIGSEHVGFYAKNAGEVKFPDLLISRKYINTYRLISSRILSVAKFDADVYVENSEYINAYASAPNGRAQISITLPFLQQIGNDPDALAVLIGHELVHLIHGHIEKAREAARTSATLGKIIGIAGAALLLSKGVDNNDALDGMEKIGGNLGKAVYYAYNRDQETESDLKGVDLAVQAGFNPQGGYRLQQIMLIHSRNPKSTWNSTHPAGSDRINQIAQYIKEKYPGYSNSVNQKTQLFKEDDDAVHDAPIKINPLFEKVQCKNQDGSISFTTRVLCIKGNGEY